MSGRSAGLALQQRSADACAAPKALLYILYVFSEGSEGSHVLDRGDASRSPVWKVKRRNDNQIGELYEA